MRRYAFLFAAAILAALPAAAQAAPPILVVDRDALFERYIDPALDAEKTKARKDALTLKIAEQARRQAPDAIVFDKNAILMYRATADITPLIEAALDKTEKPVNGSAPSPADGHAVNAMESRPFVIDRAAIVRDVPSPSRDALEKRLDTLLQQVVMADDVPFILDRADVALGLVDCDITQKVVTRLNGGSAEIAAPDPKPAGMVFIDRTRILADSKVGQSIVTQVHDLATAADHEFRAEADALHAEGEALQAKLPSLAPQEQTAKTADFDARTNAFESKVQAREKSINDAVLAARHAVESGLQPLLLDLMHRKDAALLVDRSAVIAFPDGIDVTGDAVAALDRAMPDLKLEMHDAHD